MHNHITSRVQPLLRTGFSHSKHDDKLEVEVLLYG